MTTGLRERKKVATRLRLHYAALHLVAERGLAAVSVDDIAERCDVSPRTFFNYFASKDDAVIGLGADDPDELATAFAARPADESPVHAIRAVHRDQAERMAQESELWLLRLQVVDSDPELAAKLAAAFGRTERTLAAAIAERTGIPLTSSGCYPALLATVQTAIMRAALNLWFASGLDDPLPDLVDEAWDCVVAGLPVPTTYRSTDDQKKPRPKRAENHNTSLHVDARKGPVR